MWISVELPCKLWMEKVLFLLLKEDSKSSEIVPCTGITPMHGAPSGPGIGSYSAVREGDLETNLFSSRSKASSCIICPTDIGEEKNLAKENREQHL
jgi:hypothetical protein